MARERGWLRSAKVMSESEAATEVPRLIRKTMRRCSKHGAQGIQILFCSLLDLFRSCRSSASLDSFDLEGLDTITEEPPVLVHVFACPLPAASRFPEVVCHVLSGTLSACRSATLCWGRHTLFSVPVTHAVLPLLQSYPW